MARVLVEGSDAGAEALAALLAAEGHEVERYTPGSDPGRPEVAYLDVWTPEVAPHVVVLRERGARLSCLADLVLERSAAPVAGITGTAGKTTTAAILAGLLRSAGVEVRTGSGPSANLWPDPSLLQAAPRDAWVVAELTSSHLCFVHSSPRVAVVTCLWPDHVELHGSLAAYRAAKERIVRFQREGDWLVLPACDAATEGFASLTPAAQVGFGAESAGAGLERGVFLRSAKIVARWEGEEMVVADTHALALRGPALRSALAAAAAALCAGVAPEQLERGLLEAEQPAHRLREVARVGGVAVLDDSMAATPAKTRAALETFADGSVVLVAGGLAELPTGAVHGSPEERRLVEEACREAVRACRLVVLFGQAAEVLAPLLDGVETERADTLDEAVRRAAKRSDGAAAILVSPMFPVAAADRERVAALARSAA